MRRSSASVWGPSNRWRRWRAPGLGRLRRRCARCRGRWGARLLQRRWRRGSPTKPVVPGARWEGAGARGCGTSRRGCRVGGLRWAWRGRRSGRGRSGPWSLCSAVPFGRGGWVLTQRHVDGELLEASSRELRGNAVAHSAECFGLVQRGGSRHIEVEVIVQVDRLGGDEIGGRGLLVLGSREVDVLRAYPGRVL